MQDESASAFLLFPNFMQKLDKRRGKMNCQTAAARLKWEHRKICFPPILKLQEESEIMTAAAYQAAFVRVAPRVPGVLYTPAVPGEKSRLGVIAMHCEADYLDHSIGPGLAKRGYTVLCANTHDDADSAASKIRDVGAAMRFLRALPGIEKVVVMGHSGGATLMSAYQAVAEHGPAVFRGPEKLIPLPAEGMDGLIPADGFLGLDSNWGNGAMRLFGTDPAILDEQSGVKIDPALDAFSPANGWTPEGAHYSDEFLARWFAGQRARNERLIAHALDRLAVLNAGKGYYLDDEPMIVPAAVLFGPNNKLFPQDVRLLSRTAEPQKLIHNGGTVTTGVVHTLRRPRHLQSCAPYLFRGAMHTSVKKFLDSWAVRTEEGYHYDDRRTYGIDFHSAYTCTPGNIAHVTVPTLILGMNASWEFSAVETILQNSGAADKQCGFIEGADHDFYTDHAAERFPGEFGDTTETTYDYVDKWLSAPGRFF